MIMPSRKRHVHFLNLVEGKPEPAPLKREDLFRPALQNTLFAAEHPALLFFINFELVTEADFLTVLAARPRFVLDLRRVPRFDVGGLNRRVVFSLFAQSQTRYIDLSGGISSKGERDAQLAAGSLGEYLRNTLLSSSRGLAGC